MKDVSTLVDLLRLRATVQPEAWAYTFLQDGENESGRLTFLELDRQARAIAALIQSQVPAGERALLLYQPGLEFVTAFFGCLYAGVLAVPAYPPRADKNLTRLQAIVTDAEAKVVLTTETLRPLLMEQGAQNAVMSSLLWLGTDRVDPARASEWRAPAIHGETVAFLQYTSGSTGAPKGVMVSHRNLLHNSELLKRGMADAEESIHVGWLPLFHDMGLIAMMLQSLYRGRPGVLMPPAAFLQAPIRWLRALSHYRATITGAPNFAYDLCVRRTTPEQRAGLDLSHLRIAFNGAEPIRLQTLERFAETFAPYGFRKEAFYPCYGLAESTVFVAGGLAAEPPVVEWVDGAALEQHEVRPVPSVHLEAHPLVGCGRAWMDQRFLVVDPRTLEPCSPGAVGELWVRGPSVAQGYWNRPRETEETFGARLAGSAEGPFLRTGDLAFLRGEELFITGRLKDLIIIRGRNHYPQDIELAAEESHPALRRGCSAAFPVDVEGEERLALVLEVEKGSQEKLPAPEVMARIREAVLARHELQVHAIALIRTGTIPKTSSGKIQRRACRAGLLNGTLEVLAQWREGTDATKSSGSVRAGEERAPAHRLSAAAEAIRGWLVARLSERLKVGPQSIDSREPFSRYGLDSAAAVGLSGELQEWLGRPVSPTLVYDHPSIDAVALHLAGGVSRVSTPRLEQAGRDEPIAIIGMGCRLPGAESPEAFWSLLHGGRDVIREVPPERWDVESFYAATPATPGKMSTRWGGFLEQVDRFDPGFFGISPREARGIDPQQRLLLEVGWEALENAGYAPTSLAGSRTGVFIGISSSDYAQLQFSRTGALDAYSGTGGALSIAANRLSYLMDWHGPSMAVDTACSSSLVALHQACQSLRRGECSLALAGGVNLLLAPHLTVTFSQARMMASDGRCKTFDASADGYVRSEGAGVVVLKRLSDALRDGDTVLALVRGSAVNQDGRSNGLTAPNGPAQQEVIRQALADAGVDATRIGYVEAHGTGTPLGDPIELHSLRDVLMPGRSPEQRCWVGSVKTNVGHLEAAAGITGVLKVVLSLKHQEIPAHLHFEKLNPHISIEGVPLAIPAERQPWPSGRTPRLAGVSSFGFGGTNAHVILEEAPAPAAAPARASEERPLHVLGLSARSESALRELARRHATWLAAHPELSVADVCFSANTGRSRFEHRLAAVAETGTELRARLEDFAAGRQASTVWSRSLAGRRVPKVAFLFTGQGSQYVGMGRRLHETQPVFRRALERCDEVLRPLLEQPLLSVLFSGPEEGALLHETAYTQPALFALEYALATLWRSWGIEPACVMGHSVGEYVAACVAGVFSLEDGLKLIATRGRLMQALPRDGGMVTVFASEARVAEALRPHAREVSIAAINGPESIVLSGRREAVRSVVGALEAEGVKTRALNVSHAFHSPLMEPVLDAFQQVAAGVSYAPSRVPLISNLTGKPLDAGELNAHYWSRHLREPVRFLAGMETLRAQGCEVFLEVGPAPTLLGLGRRCLPEVEEGWLPSLRPGQPDWQPLSSSLAELYVRGVAVDWAGFDAEFARRRVALPTYPFQRERYWLEPGEQAASSGTPVVGVPNGRGHPLLGRRLPELAHLPGHHVWATELAQRHLTFINDHRIQGAVVVPGVVYLELALAAAAEAFGSRPLVLGEVEYNKVLFVPDTGAQSVQVSLTGSPDKDLSFHIHSRPAERASEPWTLHARGRLIPG
ncbi:AMP-binding protein [Archangium violaceum]|uniref:type I polyketide synthase n=1 Tax=Archangium violaceum TaxID=83451 RepID=UPI00193B166C|nr:type I polyketide synthase [Archangium violaceum]QRK08317.1 AMP-binding protein [Archangium violaceum]